MSDLKTRIIAKIDDVRYQSFLTSQLNIININDFDINTTPTSCIVKDEINEIAISKWVSPKRTRSYPYARVYDTISRSKRATVIPVVKDEGSDGDRDFLQWDTICLMSLLQVSVILGYYQSASKNQKYTHKVTKQKFDSDWIKERIKRLSSNYQSDALHWNIRQVRDELSIVIQKQIEACDRISKTTGVTFHNLASLTNFKEIIERDIDEFINHSRTRAEQAQSRELSTIHIYENLATASKASITITNIVGGKYFFTVDEVLVNLNNSIIELIECKNSSSALLPSKADIKDGLLKMILYTNLKNLEIQYLGEDINNLQPKPILRLTSASIKSEIESSQLELLEEWLSNHKVKSKSTKLFIQELFQEARYNNFVVQLKSSK
ncbi:hypothetical protein [Brunnivagina elsteri]|uniref:Uncharacterized protein n=1 Tax=Brunnivagina elsteri CCALA 953 TaxID=987040 RepID=A0A2A2TKC0_9CYAN|nr:hypothetical protein [Calothrix elsteri]PAX56524.1 hypothetical protein CK510_10105 [Calothrix elsteri CCALA 953]